MFLPNTQFLNFYSCFLYFNEKSLYFTLPYSVVCVEEKEKFRFLKLLISQSSITILIIFVCFETVFFYYELELQCTVIINNKFHIILNLVCLQTADIGVTETVRGDSNKFEVWSKIVLYTMQVSTCFNQIFNIIIISTNHNVENVYNYKSCEQTF